MQCLNSIESICIFLKKQQVNTSKEGIYTAWIRDVRKSVQFWVNNSGEDLHFVIKAEKTNNES